ncbi:hypothetical protein FOL47_000065 [Perkinsus chesapeaki]|uniref:AB hydrolase-1 domain-containing protein n=1 Tax=Perkinsus chesapeaki TaxID=330153 RepID=A0A7J6N3N0_PERCH|nr:hypothetical protein FOL47_000065 [Perkinsus chesapeaki]
MDASTRDSTLPGIPQRNRQQRKPIRVRTADDCEISGAAYIPASFAPGYEHLFVLLVHPWGKMGGSSANTKPLAKMLSGEYCMNCVTFDTRGVGASTGSSTLTGHAEVEDVVAVAKYVQEYLAPKGSKAQFVLLGSSAGAAIAGSAAPLIDNCVAAIYVGYTFGFMSRILFGKHVDNLKKLSCPKLFIMGTEDCWTSVSQLKSYLRDIGPSAEYRLIDGAGHFELENNAERARQIVDWSAEFIAASLPPQP